MLIALIAYNAFFGGGGEASYTSLKLNILLIALIACDDGFSKFVFLSSLPSFASWLNIQGKFSNIFAECFYSEHFLPAHSAAIFAWPRTFEGFLSLSPGWWLVTNTNKDKELMVLIR